MPRRLNRFRLEARRVLEIANEEAERLHHNYIGTEHVLLGLVEVQEGLASMVLRDMGAQPNHIRQLVERMTGAGARTSPGKLDLTPRTKQMLEYAVEEARKLDHDYIGSEHLLLGLIRQGDGVAIDVFRQLGLTPEAIRQRVLEELKDSETGAPDDETAREKPEVAQRAADRQWAQAVEALMQRLGALDAEQLKKLVEYAVFLQWQAKRPPE